MTTDFWQIWKEFEVKHGNEDTLREMLRIKRSVQAVYNTQVNMMASAMMQETGPIGTVSDLAPTLTLGIKDDMWRLEAKGMESDVKVIFLKKIYKFSSSPLLLISDGSCYILQIIHSALLIHEK